jgi:hypothetical protein
MTFLKTKKSLGLIGSFHSKHDGHASSQLDNKTIQCEEHKSQDGIHSANDYSTSDEIIIPRKGKTASSDISVNSAKFSFASSIRSNWSKISKKFRFPKDSVRANT